MGLQVLLEDGFALFGQFIKWMEAGVVSGSGAANTEEVIYLRDPMNPWVCPASAHCCHSLCRQQPSGQCCRILQPARIGLMHCH